VELKQSHTVVQSLQQLVATKSIFKSSATACLPGVQTHYPSLEAYNTP